MITVEDGTGLPNADAYVSVAHADAYHAQRGHDSWAGTDEDKEHAIVRATDHVERVYGHRWRGRRSTRDQALGWPRIGAMDDDGYSLDGVPVLLERAVAEYALRALLAGELTPDVPSPVPPQDLGDATEPQSTDEPAGRVVEEEIRVGPVTERKRYQDPKPGSAGDLPAYPGADLFLRQLIESPQRRLIRC